MAVSTDIFVAIMLHGVFSVMPPALCTSVSPSVPSNSVNQTPPCKLYNVTMFDCRGRNLSATPIDVPTTLTHLDLSINRISNMTGFNFLTNLKALNFSANIIQAVVGSTFQGLVSLQILDLSQNSINYLATDAFIGLQRLVQLDLSSNNIFTISPATFESLGELLDLSLQVNDLTEIPSDAFAHLRKIKTLDLSFNLVQKFELGPGFQSMKDLKRLLLFGMNIEFLVNTTLSALSSLPLEYIDLSFNDVVYIDTGAFYPVRNIKGLSLRQTNYQIIDVLPSGLFELDLSGVDSVVSNGVLTVETAQTLSMHLPQVKSISLAENKMKQIEDSALGHFATLEELDLSLNRLEASGMNKETFAGLLNLEELQLSDNRLNEIPKEALTTFNVTGSLRRLNLAGNNLINLKADDFASVHSLTSLNLERNGIYNLNNCLDHLQNLKFLYLAMNQLYRLPPTEGLVAPLQSLRLLDMSRNPGGEYLTNTLCTTLAPALEELYVSNIRDDFEVSILLNCTSLTTLDVSYNGLTDYDFYTRGLYAWGALNLPKLETLNLAGNAMQSLRVNIFQRTPRLRRINCSTNAIEMVDGMTFEDTRDIEYLDLSANQLANLSALNPQHLPNLQSAIFSGNKISFVDVELLEESRLPSLSLLDLSHNPFSCTCDVEDFNQWLLEDARLLLPSPLEYKCNSPSSLQGYFITQLVFDKCVSRLALYLGVSSAAVLVCIITVTIFCVRYHWHLRYKWFLLFPRRRLIRREGNEEDNNDDGAVHNNPPKFDAFVSYNDHDQEWVVRQLIPRLEEDNDGERFRLCVSDRDLPAGGSRTDAVVAAIHDSRKTVLVLSDHFMESEWCYYEMQMAHQRLFNEGQDVLILILLKDVSDNKMTLLLRQTLCTKTYFKWPNDNLGQQLFWDRLKAELKIRSAVNRRLDTQNT